MSTAARKANGAKSQGATTAGPRVRWDDSQLQSTYANVCNVASTREELALFFGLNQAWHPGQKDVTVRLTNRVVLNPHAAKRLLKLLTKVLAEYEKRFGELPLDPEAQGPMTAAPGTPAE